MLIDWFTVGAQALNFLILVWLMKRFLYRPILGAVEAREKKIAAELADADSKKAEAKLERDEFRRKNAEFDRHRAAEFARATAEAEAEGRRLREEARRAAELETVKRRDGLRDEAKRLGQTLAALTRKEVFAIARKALTDLAAASLEERMSGVFCRRLRLLDGKTKADLGASLKAAAGPAIVRSAFDLAPQQRAELQQALNETFCAEVRVRFETTPNLVAGIELAMDGHKVAWTIADYLASLEAGVGDLLQAKNVPEHAVR